MEKVLLPAAGKKYFSYSNSFALLQQRRYGYFIEWGLNIFI
jgi:hypothetical protein